MGSLRSAQQNLFQRRIVQCAHPMAVRADGKHFMAAVLLFARTEGACCREMADEAFLHQVLQCTANRKWRGMRTLPVKGFE